MTHQQNHRGAHPEDRRLFGPDAIAVLRAALDDAAYLLERGYAATSVVDTVGRRYELEARQRMALSRSMCSVSQSRARRERLVALEAVGQRSLFVDGFNLVIGVEVALSGGLLLRGRDGALRDLAGLRGSYHPVTETDGTLDLVGSLLAIRKPRDIVVYLDSPVSNSGRLRGKILEHAAGWPFGVEVELVHDADAALRGRALVVSSDSVVIDRAESWVDLAGAAAETIAGAWIVDLGS